MDIRERRKVLNIMKSLDESKGGLRAFTSSTVPGMTVDGSSTNIRIRQNGRKHALQMNLWWQVDHYHGSFADSEGEQDQAIVAVWNVQEAIKLVAILEQLFSLRARRRRPK